MNSARFLLLMAGISMAFGCSDSAPDKESQDNPPKQTPPTKSPPSDTTPPAQPVANGNAGVFDCPTINSPAYTLRPTNTLEATLSPQFQQACASCHGAQGEGQEGYPALRGGVDKQTYIERVREGFGESMPAFDAAFVSDDVLGADYDALKALAGSDSTATYGDEWDWSPEEIEQARTEGLAAWRKPDAVGVACANCHTPDALDVALLGYPDHAIIRRARLHLDTADTNKVVRFVHAQRRHFNIKEPCHPQYRPFQPGGRVLEGDTPQQKDEAFGAILRERALTVATGRVETLEQAQAALDQVRDINIRTLPLGVAFPRWTEDGFNGEAHATLNDYMPSVGFRPNSEDAAQWYALNDAYIAQPTQENLLKLLAQFDEMNHDGGFLDEHNTPIQNCRGFKVAGDLLHTMSRHKRRSQYLMQHWLRRGVSEGLTLADLDALPLPLQGEDADNGLNPFMDVAKDHIEAICYPSTDSGKRASEEILRAMPQEVLDEMPQKDLDEMVLKALPEQMNNPWTMLAQIYDPSYGQSNLRGNTLHYWQVLKFPQKRYHRPFYAVHRIAQRARYYDMAQLNPADPALPGDTRFGKVRTIHPWLDGNRVFIRESVQASNPDTADSIRMGGNVIRAVLLVQIDLLKQGNEYSNRTTFTRQVDTFKQWAGKVERSASDEAKDALGEDFELYTQGVEALCEELLELLVADKENTDEREVGSR